MNNSYNKVSVIGLGYIGLPTATVLASKGIHVVGVDINQHAVDTINSGRIHIVEPGLDVMVNEVVKSGLLKASTKPEPSDAFIIAVPTPFRGSHEPDMSYVEAAIKSIAPHLAKRNLIILESTSPVGSTEYVASLLKQLRPDLVFPLQSGEGADVQIAYCPERVLPGNVLFELLNNDRIIGGVTSQCSQAAVQLYKTFVEGQCLITNARTAEMSKLTENAFRDVNIAFANELSLICDESGIDVWELIKLANHHPRVNILKPGPGVGGHCIAVDPWFIVHSAPERARMIRVAREVNDSKPYYVLEKVKRAVGFINKPNPVIACLGLSFKADIDDLRESPAVEITRAILDGNMANVLVVEPNVEKLPDSFGGKAVQLVKLDDALSQADILVVLVDHKEFLGLAKMNFADKVIVDTRGLITVSRD